MSVKLRKGEIPLIGRAKKLFDQVFGRLTALYAIGKTERGNYIWLCRCSCGGTKKVTSDQLLNGKVKSCGCLQIASRIRHGHSNHPLWKIYFFMIHRCHNKNSQAWKDYGGRGIKVCRRWREGANGKDGFTCFLEDMGRRPKGYDMDRIDNDKGYSPDNCRWASKATNMNNRRVSVKVSYKGETKSILEWSKSTGIAYGCLWGRRYAGWPVERMLTEGAVQ